MLCLWKENMAITVHKVEKGYEYGKRKGSSDQA